MNGGCPLSKESVSPALGCSGDFLQETKNALRLGLERETSWMVPGGSDYFSLLPGFGGWGVPLENQLVPPPLLHPAKLPSASPPQACECLCLLDPGGLREVEV